MKLQRHLVVPSAALVLAVCGGAFAQPFNPASPNVRISQVYTFGGGNGTNPVPTYRNDFVELFNPTQRTIDLSTWSLQVASATSNATWAKLNLTGSIGPGKYYLVSMAGGSNTAPGVLVLPTPEITWGTGMGTTGSKVALVASQSITLIGQPATNPANNPLAQSIIIDLLGMGANSNVFLDSPFPAVGSLIQNALRTNVCVDTRNNSADFVLATPNARNGAVAAAPCAIVPLDLTLVATGPIAPIGSIGATATFTVNVDNLGTELLGTTNASLTAVFPNTVDYVSSSVGGTYNAATRTLTAPLPEIGAAPFRLPVTITGATAANGTASVLFSVGSADAEPNTNNNTANVQVIVNQQADLSLSMTSSVADCSMGLAQDAPLEYALTVSNAGAAAALAPVATVTLPGNLEYLDTSTVSAGTLASSNGTVTWTMPSLANGSSHTATLRTRVTAPGVIRTFSSLTAATFDGDLSNNSARTTNLSPKAGVGYGLVVCSVAGHPTNLVATPNPGGAPFFTTYNTNDAFLRPFVSPDGTKFVFRGVLAESSSDVILSGTANRAAPAISFQAREGFTAIDGASAGVFKPFLSINDGGDFVFGTNTTGPVTADEIVAKANVAMPEIFSIITREGSLVLPFSPAAVLYGATSYATGITNAGDIAVLTTLTGEGIITSGTSPVQNNGAIVTGGGAVLSLQRGVTIPGNQLAGPGNATWSVIQGGGGEGMISTRSADGAHGLVNGQLNTGTTANDEVLVVDGSVVLQESVAIPSSGIADPVLSLPYSYMEADGTWYAYGRFGPAGFGWVVRNGAVLAKHGDAIVSGSAETYAGNATNPAFANTFFMATGRGTDYVVGGVTNNADTYQNSVLVHNGTTVIAREGDPIDLDGNGVADDDSYIANFPQNRAFISGDRKLWVVVDVRTRAATCNAASTNVTATPAIIGQAMLVIDLPAIPPLCLSDINADGITDGNDFTDFINSFGVGDVTLDPRADVVPDSIIDGNDFIAFINAFAAGC